jgi:hypothetical protein
MFRNFFQRHGGDAFRGVIEADEKREEYKKLRVFYCQPKLDFAVTCQLKAVLLNFKQEII